MKRSTLIACFLILFLSACGSLATTALPQDGDSPCGDGLCQGAETAQNCPADCTSQAVATAPSTGPAPTPSGDAPLYMTTMTHMEGGHTDDELQEVFQTHIEQLTFGMDLADEYGARLTIESERPFAIANTKWSRNFMAEILARGHGVGTHCDFGFRSERMPVEQYARFFSENKSLVDDLVGGANNLGCSGGGGANDWALAASLAGFKYLDGIVGMHYLSMPLENRPDPSWTDEFIFESGFHLNAPVDLYDRIYPFMVADAEDFLPDENGVILVSSGELGTLAAMAEKGMEAGSTGCSGSCILNMADVDALLATILELDQNRDRSRIAKVTVYLPANIYQVENEAVLRYFFGEMRSLVDQGIITWATQIEVYQAYLDWNK